MVYDAYRRVLPHSKQFLSSGNSSLRTSQNVQESSSLRRRSSRGRHAFCFRLRRSSDRRGHGHWRAQQHGDIAMPARSRTSRSSRRQNPILARRSSRTSRMRSWPSPPRRHLVSGATFCRQGLRGRRRRRRQGHVTLLAKADERPSRRPPAKLKVFRTTTSS